MKRSLLLALALGAVSVGCGDDDAMPDAGADAGPTDAAPADVGPPPACGTLPVPPDVACTEEPTDYTPGADDMWPACISDDGTYHRIMEVISTIQRVQAFEELAASLFDPTRDPSPDDFLEGRLTYQEDEGLDSRVVRRYDPHFEVPEGTDCTAEGVPAMYPDYCVGPGKLQPILLDAFAAGIEGGGDVAPRVHAARIEGALLWFLYASVYKEAFTCTGTPKDCDSSYAYYTGGETARGGIGLARYVDEVDPEAHDAAWDGLLAVRCWRDLDPAVPATDLDLRDRARAQYDRAVLDGVAAIVRDRLTRLCDATGDELAYHWAFLQTLAPVLEPSFEARDATQAATFFTELGRPLPGDVDVPAMLTALDAAYRCP